jgi:hypothetical protein
MAKAHNLPIETLNHILSYVDDIYVRAYFKQPPNKLNKNKYKLIETVTRVRSNIQLAEPFGFVRYNIPNKIYGEHPYFREVSGLLQDCVDIRIQIRQTKVMYRIQLYKLKEVDKVDNRPKLMADYLHLDYEKY